MAFNEITEIIEESFALVIAGLRRLGKKTPYYVNYDITSDCTQKCEACYFEKTYDKKGKIDLTDEEWLEIFKRDKKAGVSNVFLTGGEPSLRPEVIEMAHNIFTTVTIISNGTKKIPENIERRIFISLDGPKEVHNKTRGVNSYDKVIENIKGDKRVILSPCISTKTYKHIPELVKIAKDLGVSGVMFSLYTSHQGQDDSLYLKGHQLEETLSMFKRLKKQYGDFIFTTNGIIDSFREKQYIETCPMSKANPRFASYYPDLTKKEPCTLGEGVECETCGCIAPIIPCRMKKLDVETLLMAQRMYPLKYRVRRHGSR